MRVLLRALVVLVCLSSAPAAAESIHLDVARIGTLNRTADPGTYTVILDNVIPTARYDVTVFRESIPIATLPLDGIKPLTGFRALESAGCEPLTKAMDALAKSEKEADVPAHAAALRAALAANSCPAAAPAAKALLDGTSHSIGEVIVGRNQRVTITVSRAADDKRAAATWTVVLTTEPRGEWAVMWGVSFLDDQDQQFFTKAAAAAGKFNVTRERDEAGLRLVPSVYFSWLSRAQKDRSLSFGPTAGFGLSSGAASVFGGVSFTWNQNIGLVAGVGVTGYNRLDGRYSEGQEVAENLSNDQLHQRVYRPAVTAALTFRFGKNPFADDTPAPAPPAQPAAPAAPSTPPAKPEEKPKPPTDTGTPPPAPAESVVVRDPDVRLRFTANGEIVDRAPLDGLVGRAATATDVFIVSHGWWNDQSRADCFYSRIIGGIQQHRPEYLTDDRFKPIYVSIYWPSALFPMEPSDCDTTAQPARAEAAVEEALSPAAVQRWATGAFPGAAARPPFAGELARVTALLEKEHAGSLAASESRELVSILMRWQQASGAEAGASEVAEPSAFAGTPAEVAERWQQRPEGREELDVGALSKKWLNFGNAFTFWTMKQRAGTVGARGVYGVVKALQPAVSKGLRIHLVGHSFGGKVVTAAITGAGGATPNRVSSLVILQGAFSQFAFATREQIEKLGVSVDRHGLYADVLRSNLVSGPIVVTRSSADVANRLLYPAGVALVNDVTEATRAPRFGSLGANGVQGPAVATVVLAEQGLGDPPPNVRAITVDASGVILGHSDLVKSAVFKLIWDATALAARVP